MWTWPLRAYRVSGGSTAVPPAPKHGRSVVAWMISRPPTRPSRSRVAFLHLFFDVPPGSLPNTFRYTREHGGDGRRPLRRGSRRASLRTPAGSLRLVGYAGAVDPGRSFQLPCAECAAPAAP